MLDAIMIILLVALFIVQFGVWLLAGMPLDARIVLLILVDALLVILVRYSFRTLGVDEEKPSDKAPPDVSQKEKQEAPRPAFVQQVDAIGKKDSQLDEKRSLFLDRRKKENPSNKAPNKAPPDVSRKEKQEAPRPVFVQQVDATGKKDSQLDEKSSPLLDQKKVAQFCEESVPQRYRKRIFGRRRTLVEALHTPGCCVWKDGNCTCGGNVQTYEDQI